MKLFRFQAINKLTIQNLTKQNNWVADPYSFNDPFEFSMCDGFLLEPSGFRNMNPIEEAKTKKIKETINSFGVVCYSALPINNILWAHYADDHRGMCLVFEIPKENQVALRKVQYQTFFPKINLTDEVIKYEEIFKIVTTKSKEWEYENEYREVFDRKNTHQDYPGKLSEIIFACRTLLDDIKMIARIARNIDNDIIISKMHLNQFDYRLLKSSLARDQEIPELWGPIGIRI